MSWFAGPSERLEEWTRSRNIERLIAAVEDPPRGMSRDSVSHALLMIADIEPAQRMVPFLIHKNSDVRELVVQALKNIHAPELAKILCDHMQAGEPNDRVRLGIAQALEHCPADGLVDDAMSTLIVDSGANARQSAIRYFGSTCEDRTRAVCELTRALDDRDDQNCAVALDALADRATESDGSAVEALGHLLLARDVRFQSPIGTALSRIGSPGALPFLMECLHGRQPVHPYVIKAMKYCSPVGTPWVKTEEAAVTGSWAVQRTRSILTDDDWVALPNLRVEFLTGGTALIDTGIGFTPTVGVWRIADDDLHADFWAEGERAGGGKPETSLVGRLTSDGLEIHVEHLTRHGRWIYIDYQDDPLWMLWGRRSGA